MTERSLAVNLALQNMRAQRASGRRVPRKPVMPQVWKYPAAQEKVYANQIAAIVKPFTDIVAGFLVAYPSWTRQDGFRADGFAQDWDKAMQALRAHQKKVFEDHEGRDVCAMVSGIGNSVHEFNFKEWSAYLSKLAGQPYYPPSEPWVANTVETWSDLNFELIRSLTDDYIKQVNTKVVDAVSSGISQTDLMKAIQKINTNISKPRARLIARDQVGKLNGQLTGRRQADAGVEEYTWKTAQDERVRSTHAIMQGRGCEWKDATKYKVLDRWTNRSAGMTQHHPGYDIQCRCYASPNMDAIWAEAEDIAKAEGWYEPRKSVAPLYVPPPKPITTKPVRKAPIVGTTAKNAPGAKPSPPKSYAIKTAETKTAFSKAPEWLRNAVGRADKDFRGMLPDQVDQGAFYNAAMLRIHMGPSYRSGGKYASQFDDVWRHEVGHHLDYMVGPRGGKFSSGAMWSDRKLSDEAARIYGTTKKKTLSYGEAANVLKEKSITHYEETKRLFSEVFGEGSRRDAMRYFASGNHASIPMSLKYNYGGSREQHTQLMDIFAAITKNGLGFGHTDEYWRGAGSRATEIFAQFTALTGHPTNGSAWSSVLGEMFPDLYSEWVTAVKKFGGAL